jgi:hypothetical protein
MPRDMGSYSEVFRTWKAASMLLALSDPKPAEQREALRRALAVEWTAPPSAVVQGTRIVLSPGGGSRPVEAFWRPGNGAPILAVHPDGVQAALRSAGGERWMQSGRPLLILEPFVGSSDRFWRRRFDRYFYSYHRSDASEQVQGVLTALGFLRELGGRPEVIGLGDAGIWCLFAVAVAPVSVELTADLEGFGGSDEDFHRRFQVPGIQRVGGLGVALKLANRARSVVFESAPVE